jgi:hypothetical protein
VPPHRGTAGREGGSLVNFFLICESISPCTVQQIGGLF